MQQGKSAPVPTYLGCLLPRDSSSSVMLDGQPANTQLQPQAAPACALYANVLTPPPSFHRDDAHIQDRGREGKQLQEGMGRDMHTHCTPPSCIPQQPSFSGTESSTSSSRPLPSHPPPSSTASAANRPTLFPPPPSDRRRRRRVPNLQQPPNLPASPQGAPECDIQSTFRGRDNATPDLSRPLQIWLEQGHSDSSSMPSSSSSSGRHNQPTSHSHSMQASSTTISPLHSPYNVQHHQTEEASLLSPMLNEEQGFNDLVGDEEQLQQQDFSLFTFDEDDLQGSDPCDTLSNISSSSKSSNVNSSSKSSSIEGASSSRNIINMSSSSSSSSSTTSPELYGAALEGLMKACGSLEELGQVYTQHVASMNPIHVSSMLSKVRLLMRAH